MAKINFDRLESLIEESGKKKKYICELVGKERYYIRDAKKQGTDIPEKYIKIWADELNTTTDYLLGYTDEKEKPVSARAELDKLIDGMGREELIDFIAKATEKLREQK